jgi:hypothetical protein
MLIPFEPFNFYIINSHTFAFSVLHYTEEKTAALQTIYDVIEQYLESCFPEFRLLKNIPEEKVKLFNNGEHNKELKTLLKTAIIELSKNTIPFLDYESSVVNTTIYNETMAEVGTGKFMWHEVGWKLLCELKSTVVKCEEIDDTEGKKTFFYIVDGKKYSIELGLQNRFMPV